MGAFRVLLRAAAASVMLVLAPGTAGSVLAQETAVEPPDEGPHVFWLAKDSAVVFYLCDGAPVRRLLEVKRPGGLEGFCKDTGTGYRLSNRPPTPAPATFDDGERIFAVSDIHGEYEALVGVLANAGIVDDDLRWSWGKGHLVILGDVFDRGERVTECLWLIHRLEAEAREAGGRVHYLLGNHELMVLQGDLRYVNERYMDGIVRATGIHYDDLFGPAMELGRWLRTKHLAVRLNGVLFVHGGIGPAVVDRKLTLREINDEARKGIDMRSYDLAFRDLPKFLLGSQGPLWYRGYHRAMDYPQATEGDIGRMLEHFDAKQVVVGHTDIGEIQALYGGRVFGIDVDVAKLGSLQGLLWQDGVFYKVEGDGSRKVLSGNGDPEPQSPASPPTPPSGSGWDPPGSR